MGLPSWLRKRPTFLPERATFRPRIEALEDRWLPSTLTVQNNLDSGAGSLRAAITAAHSATPSVSSRVLQYGPDHHP